MAIDRSSSPSSLETDTSDVGTLAVPRPNLPNLQDHRMLFDPYQGSPRQRPPTPPVGPPPLPVLPPNPTRPQIQPPRGPEPVQVNLLKLASRAGKLQDVHQILMQYILRQTPDPITGRFRLYLFHESIREAIHHNRPIILSYLLFMRVGEPSLYLSPALEARSSSIFQVFLDYGWNINEPLERTRPPTLG